MVPTVDLVFASLSWHWLCLFCYFASYTQLVCATVRYSREELCLQCSTQAYNTASWTLTFSAWTKPTPASRTQQHRCAHNGDEAREVGYMLGWATGQCWLMSVLLTNKMDKLRTRTTTQREIRECCALIITEIWFSDSTPNSVLLLHTHSIHHEDRTEASKKTRGGGVCTLTTDGVGMCRLLKSTVHRTLNL